MGFMSTGQPAGLTERTTRAIQDVLAGKKKGVLTRLLFAGPAVIASIAYVDPGNFATNLQAGAEFGYSLLWVVLSANIIAMLFQALSAKLGIVTQKNLAQICREQLPRKLVYAMWAVSEIAAVATDLAEFLGGAIGLSLLLHLPLVEGMIITGIVTYAILLMEQQGYRPIELAIGAFVSIIALCYLLEMLVAPVSWGAAVHGMLVPHLGSSQALAVSAGILGATVMPHAIYLHSGLTQNRAPAKNNVDRRKLLSFSNKETVIALTLAGMVNMAMVVMASAAFHAGHADIAEVETAYRTLTPLLGAGAAAVFLVSLLASGISSSVVGTMAGQMIMQGFVGFPIPVWIRRLVTMLPAFAVIALGVNATDALVYSQVVLSFALPVPMIALIVFTSRRDIMGEFVNSRGTRLAALAGTTVVLILNTVLILQTFGVAIPGLPAA
ncbi:divalent metal cation transporter [Burkholderia sp. Ax-1719]|nr:divalent metal cation transporter [Burkholderia sp. Ax-1719]